MKSISFGILSLLVTIVNAKSTVFESLHDVPTGFKRAAIPDPSTIIPLKISLVQPRKDAFEQRVMEISTPGHELYGEHMNRLEIRTWLKPEDIAVKNVLDWLQAQNVTELDHDNDWVHINTSVSTAEKLLDTKFYLYANERTGDAGIRTTEYSLPIELQKHINMVQPTTRFPSITVQRSLWRDLEKAGVASGRALTTATAPNSAFNTTSCNATITPACLKHIYQFGDFKADPDNGNKFGIAGYLEEYAKYSDLKTFLKEYAPEAATGNFSFQSVNGGLNTQGFNESQDDVEANLDVQYGISISYPVPVTYYVTGGRAPLIPDNDQPELPGSNEPYLEFLAYMKTVPDHELPQTISTSYGEVS
jgi:tripeptidyl-peptidase I